MPNPRTATAAAPRPAAPAASPLRVDSPLSMLSRIRSTEVKLLQKLGLETVRDLLLYLPREWEAFHGPSSIAELRDRDDATMVVTVVSSLRKRTKFKGKLLTEATVSDDRGGRMKVVGCNMPYLAEKLTPGTRLALAGKVSLTPDRREMPSPHYQGLGRGAAAPRPVRGPMAD